MVDGDPVPCFTITLHLHLLLFQLVKGFESHFYFSSVLCSSNAIFSLLLCSREQLLLHRADGFGVVFFEH